MDKETLKKYWKNPRTHALMVLIIWIVSLGALMGIVAIMSALSPNQKIESPAVEENKKGISYEEKLQNLLSDDYLMTFLVTTKDGTLKYEGTEQSEIVNGYKEDANGIKKFRMEKDTFYEVILDQTTEIESIYEEITEEFLDRNTLVSLLLKTEEEGITDNKESSTHDYNLLFKEENIKISVIETKESIETITIENESANYQLTFSKNKN